MSGRHRSKEPLPYSRHCNVHEASRSSPSSCLYLPLLLPLLLLLLLLITAGAAVTTVTTTAATTTTTTSSSTTANDSTKHSAIENSHTLHAFLVAFPVSLSAPGAKVGSSVHGLRMRTPPSSVHQPQSL